jgi:hypothetical protein
MNNLKYAILETENSSVEAVDSRGKRKLFVVSDGSEGTGDQFTRRVEEALDYELAQGRMPA